MGMHDAASDDSLRDRRQSDAPPESAAKTAEGISENSEPPRTDGLDLPDPRKLAQDWITLWQSEISAMAADPEIRESWQTVMAFWAGTMSTVLRSLPREQNARRYDSAPGRPGAPESPWAATTASAPDTRDAEIERLAHHVAALERRLAELERGNNSELDSKINPRPRQNRKPRQ
jgi:hypothetical protein